MSMKFDQERLQELFDQEQSIAAAARKYCEENNISYTDSCRRRASEVLKKESSYFSSETRDTQTNQYERSEVLSARKEDGGIMTPQEFCAAYGLNFNEVRSYKLITHLSEPTYNIASHIINEGEEINPWDITEERIRKVVQECADYLKPSPLDWDFDKIKESCKIVGAQYLQTSQSTEPSISFLKAYGEHKALRIIISDCHISMDVSGNGSGLYDFKWDKEELEHRRKRVIEAVKDKLLQYSIFDEIHLIDLGDLTDGFLGQTTRGGHQLPQNQSTEDQFDTAVKFKMSLISDIYSLFNGRIQVISYCNSNHGGVFEYTVNSAVKMISDSMCPNQVEVKNIRKFMDHYTYGNHTFIAAHGKDKAEMAKSFPVRLDDKTKDKIEEYMKRHNLYNTERFITFEKGDSHIQILDDAGSNDFSYNSYLAFSPPSQWCQHNFTGSKSGFNLMVVDKYKNEKELTTYYF